jgi:hypothetical protein
MKHEYTNHLRWGLTARWKPEFPPSFSGDFKQLLYHVYEL